MGEEWDMEFDRRVFIDGVGFCIVYRNEVLVDLDLRCLLFFDFFCLSD